MSKCRAYYWAYDKSLMQQEKFCGHILRMRKYFSVVFICCFFYFILFAFKFSFLFYCEVWTLCTRILYSKYNKQTSQKYVIALRPYSTVNVWWRRNGELWVSVVDDVTDDCKLHRNTFAVSVDVINTQTYFQLQMCWRNYKPI